MKETTWRDLMNQLRNELDYVEGVLENSNYNEEVRLMITRGFIANFAEDLYKQ